jgi:hypothetical protein
MNPNRSKTHKSLNGSHLPKLRPMMGTRFIQGKRTNGKGRKENELCNGCLFLKYKRRFTNGAIYCEKTGLIVPGTLERSEKCKAQNLKEVKICRANGAEAA